MTGNQDARLPHAQGVELCSLHAAMLCVMDESRQSAPHAPYVLLTGDMQTPPYAEHKRVERSIFLLVIHDSGASVCLALRKHVGPAPRISSRHHVRSVFLVVSTPLTLSAMTRSHDTELFACCRWW